MAYREIIRVRNDEEHEHRLSKGQAGVLPKQPARLIELADAELDGVQGAGSPRLGSEFDWDNR